MFKKLILLFLLFGMGQANAALQILDYSNIELIQMVPVLNAAFSNALKNQKQEHQNKIKAEEAKQRELPTQIMEEQLRVMRKNNENCNYMIAKAGRPKTVRVRGHSRKNGTYVRPHSRSAPKRKR